MGGSGVDGAIHQAAGPELLAECRTLHGCKTGQAKITKGYHLPAKFVIHTVGPVWEGGSYGERELLVSAYRSSLELALEHRCETVAFPLISSGVFGYPKDQALKVAVDTIGDFLLQHDMTVYLVIFDKAAYTISGKLFSDIAAYIDDRYVEEHTNSDEERRRRQFRFWRLLPCWRPKRSRRPSPAVWTRHWNCWMRASPRCSCGKSTRRDSPTPSATSGRMLTGVCSPRFVRTFTTSHPSPPPWPLLSL